MKCLPRTASQLLPLEDALEDRGLASLFSSPTTGVHDADGVDARSRAQVRRTEVALTDGRVGEVHDLRPHVEIRVSRRSNQLRGAVLSNQRPRTDAVWRSRPASRRVRRVESRGWVGCVRPGGEGDHSFGRVDLSVPWACRRAACIARGARRDRGARGSGGTPRRGFSARGRAALLEVSSLTFRSVSGWVDRSGRRPELRMGEIDRTLAVGCDNPRRDQESDQESPATRGRHARQHDVDGSSEHC